MNIPVECVTSICSFLNGIELAILSSTCVEMNTICSESKLWVKICENEYKEWQDQPSKEEFINRANLRKAFGEVLDENPFDLKSLHDLTSHPSYRYITSQIWNDAEKILGLDDTNYRPTCAMLHLFQKQIYDERFTKILETEVDIIVVAAHLCSWNDNNVDPKEVLILFQDLVKDAKQAEVQTIHQLCEWFSLQFQKPQEYYESNNSFLHKVLEKRSGIPITLSLIFWGLARDLSIEDVHMINAPGHFICSWGEDTYIDPFNDCEILSEQELLKKHPQMTGRLNRCSRLALFRRVFNNLYSTYSGLGIRNVSGLGIRSVWMKINMQSSLKLAAQTMLLEDHDGIPVYGQAFFGAMNHLQNIIVSEELPLSCQMYIRTFLSQLCHDFASAHGYG